MKTEIRRVIEGLEICEQAGGEVVAADREKILAGDTASLSDEQKAKLKELGWHKHSEDCFQIFVN